MALASGAAFVPPFLARAEEPVAFPRSARWLMDPKGDAARRLRVDIAWPEGEPPASGWPVVILLDGNTSFPIAVAAARQLEKRGEVTGVSPAVIVAIESEGQAAPGIDPRTRDYTLPGPTAPAGSGGADDFLDAIENELKPALERRFAVDRARYVLFGHSYGGLFALHALFTRPGAFARVIAASPSIWWQDGVVLAEEARFRALPDTVRAPLSLLVAVGGNERAEAPHDPPLPPERLERMRRADMIGRAAALVQRLRAAGVGAEFVEFPGENHGSVVPVSIARALRFGLLPQ